MKYWALVFLFFTLASGRPAPAVRLIDEENRVVHNDRPEGKKLHVDVEELFEKFIFEHKREYQSEEERAIRLSNFKHNQNLVQRLNKQMWPQTTFALNQFADWSLQEFKQKVLMPKRAYNTKVHNKHLIETKWTVNSPPQEFDWRDQGAVTQVKDQGLIGSCWAFSAVGNIEGQYFLKTKSLQDLSEEQLVDCDNLDCGEFGGWPYLAFTYIKSAGGIVSESTLPYCSGLPFGEKGSCDPCMASGYNVTFCGDHSDLFCNTSLKSCDQVTQKNFVTTVKDWVAISTNETLILQELLQRGPLSVALDAELLMFYSSGVFDPPDFLCDKTDLNHAVLIVGYGTSKGIFSDTPYWTVKNSWGKNWGLSGYFHIYRGNGKCGINTAVTSALLG